MNSTQKIFLIFLITAIFISVDAIAQTRIALLYSESSKNTFEFDPNLYLNEYTAWEIFLMQNKIQYDVIYDEDLLDELEDDYDLLILPRYNTQSGEVISNLKNFQRAGKSILAVNSYFNSLFNFSHPELEDLFGISLVKMKEDNKINFTQVVIANPLNRFKANSAYLVTSQHNPQFIEVEKSNCSSAGFILNSDVKSEISTIAFGKFNSGKYVFCGFGLTDLIGGEAERVNFSLFLIDALRWLDRDVDAFPLLTKNGIEKERILFLEYNNALKADFIDVLKQNNFNPHIIVGESHKPDKNIISRFSEDQVILDLRATINDDRSNETILSYIKNYESELEVNFKSALVNQDSDLFLINKLKENGITNFITIGGKFSEANINDDGSLSLTIQQSHHKSLSKRFEVFYFIPKIDCNEDLENNYLIDLKNYNNDDVFFESINELGNRLKLEKNLSVSIRKNENVELIIRNNNLVEVNDLLLLLNMNELNLSFINENSKLNYTIDPKNGIIKIYFDKILPRSEKQVIVNAGN